MSLTEIDTKPGRRRKSHVRTFTGCQQCRQRHVKCDETRPTCENCNRMGIECAAYPFKIDMRVYNPPSARDTPLPRKRRTSSIKLGTANTREHKGEDVFDASLTHKSDKAEDENRPGQLVLVPTATGLQSASKQEESEYVVPIIPMFRPQSSYDTRFMSHFLSSVSALLIVYDNPHNANPYRLAFPRLAANSIPLQQAMHALGALHLANTTPISRDVNFKTMALTRYSDSVNGLRSELMKDVKPRLADLATVILLTFYEMMDSDTNNWQTHLRGAKDIFEKLFNVDVSSLEPHDTTSEAVRNFLVSALGYLDVAGAASSAQSTQLQGAYWEHVGGGWQYNLGVPSLHDTLPGSAPEDDNLQKIRAVWSQLMVIISDIGRFAAAKNAHPLFSTIQSESSRQSLDDRLQTWQADLPSIFNHLEEGSPYDADSVEGACCVISYFRASIIYFHQVSGTSDNNHELMSTSIDIILHNFQRFGKGVSQMGMLWAFFIAGTEARDTARQDYIRCRMQRMLSFGMGNVKRALQLLELVWLRRASNVYMDTRWFAIQKELNWSLLLP